ncbi:MAG: ATP-binding protein [Bacteroidales bacterium]
MEAFFRTHKYLVEHLNNPVRRELMDEVNWDNRLIGIKGSRGVGKTTFLLQYAKENFGTDRSCLYINLNHFYFTERSLREFAAEFSAKGGKTLLIDQVFKYPGWSEDLKYCYENLPGLKLVFTGSSVMRLKEENPVLSGLVDSYNLRGFSFREFVNMMSGTHLPSFKFEDILENHEQIARQICAQVKPLAYFQDYLHHGFYPFFLEKRNFSENLLKTMNMMLEVDVVFLKQIELTYLTKLRKLLYLLAVNAPCAPNVSQLAKEINTSRATVVNYIKYLKDARLINMLYTEDEEFPKKPSMVYMHNTNLMFPIRPGKVEQHAIRETFFYNTLHKDNRLNKSQEKNIQFLVNQEYLFRICDKSMRIKFNPSYYYAMDDLEVGKENIIPLWLFGFLY